MKIRRHPHNGGHPETPADAGEIAPRFEDGGRYRLRSGSIVVIQRNPSKESWAEARTWIGQFEGHVGERMSWRDDGCYGANWYGHELDIIERLKRRVRK